MRFEVGEAYSAWMLYNDNEEPVQENPAELNQKWYDIIWALREKERKIYDEYIETLDNLFDSILYYERANAFEAGFKEALRLTNKADKKV